MAFMKMLALDYFFPTNKKFFTSETPVKKIMFPPVLK